MIKKVSKSTFQLSVNRAIFDSSCSQRSKFTTMLVSNLVWSLRFICKVERFKTISFNCHFAQVVNQDDEWRMKFDQQSIYNRNVFCNNFCFIDNYAEQPRTKSSSKTWFQLSSLLFSFCITIINTLEILMVQTGHGEERTRLTRDSEFWLYKAWMKMNQNILNSSVVVFVTKTTLNLIK